MLVLNAALINTAIGVVQFLGSDALVGAVGRSAASLVLVYEGHMLFSIDAAAHTQAAHVMLSLKNVDASPSMRAILGLSATQGADTITMLIKPLGDRSGPTSTTCPKAGRSRSARWRCSWPPDQAPSFCN